MTKKRSDKKDDSENKLQSELESGLMTKNLTPPESTVEPLTNALIDIDIEQLAKGIFQCLEEERTVSSQCCYKIATQSSHNLIIL